MLPSHIEDFARSFLSDNRLAALAIEAGEVFPPRDVIDLVAQGQGLYFALHLHCHGPMGYRKSGNTELRGYRLLSFSQRLAGSG